MPTALSYAHRAQRVETATRQLTAFIAFVQNAASVKDAGRIDQRARVLALVLHYRDTPLADFKDEFCLPDPDQMLCALSAARLEQSLRSPARPQRLRQLLNALDQGAAWLNSDADLASETVLIIVTTLLRILKPELILRISGDGCGGLLNAICRRYGFLREFPEACRDLAKLLRHSPPIGGMSRTSISALWRYAPSDQFKRGLLQCVSNLMQQNLNAQQIVDLMAFIYGDATEALAFSAMWCEIAGLNRKSSQTCLFQSPALKAVVHCDVAHWQHLLAEGGDLSQSFFGLVYLSSFISYHFSPDVWDTANLVSLLPLELRPAYGRLSEKVCLAAAALPPQRFPLHYGLCWLVINRSFWQALPRILGLDQATAGSNPRLGLAELAEEAQYLGLLGTSHASAVADAAVITEVCDLLTQGLVFSGDVVQDVELSHNFITLLIRLLGDRTALSVLTAGREVPMQWSGLLTTWREADGSLKLDLERFKILSQAFEIDFAVFASPIAE